MFSLNIIDKYPENKILELEYTQNDFNELVPIVDYDCVITPGNSFGIMDGGFDKVIADKFPDSQRKVQDGIELYYGRELPVGSAVAVTLEAGIKLIYVPTMRFPSAVQDKAAAYNAALAAFSLINQCNLKKAPDARKKPIEHVIMPLLGTTTGGIPPHWSARQILLALKHSKGKPPRDWQDPQLITLDKELSAASNFTNLRNGK